MQTGENSTRRAELRAQLARRGLLAALTGVALIAILWLLRPLGDDEENAGRAPPGIPEVGGSLALTDALEAVPGADLERFDGFLRPLLERVDPAVDGWDSEVLAERGRQRLELLAALSSRSAAPTAGDLSEVVGAEFTATALRPARLEAVFSDATVTVLRAPPAGGESPSAQSGAEGLAEALVELLRPLRDARERRVKFKVIRIDVGEDGEFTTLALFHSSGRTAKGIVQQSAEWTCRFTKQAEGCRLKSVAVSDYEEIVPGEEGGIRFSDCTQAALGHNASFRDQLTRGVDYWRGRLEAGYGVDPNGSQGIALGDANGDGLDDLFVCQQGGLPDRLYVREPDGTLRDVSAQAGVDWMEVCRSALFVDLDNDGDQDLAMAQGWHIMIMSNDGSGRFTVTRQERSAANVYSSTAADYDNDGDLDLFFCGRNPGRELAEPEGVLGTPIPYHDANNGGPNILWENDGQGRFEDVTEEVGLDVNNRRYTFAAAWEDFDNDGDMDLYVANDYGRNNLYRNDPAAGGRRRFRDVAAELGVEDISAGMSVSWSDYNHDGLMDLYVSNMFSSAGNRIAYQRRFRTEAADSTLGQFRRHARGNTMFENLAEEGFGDVSVACGVTMGRWAWGSKFVDLNNDGFDDIYVTNGYITTEDTGDL